jgi:hypothetical protein
MSTLLSSLLATLSKDKSKHKQVKPAAPKAPKAKKQVVQIDPAIANQAQETAAKSSCLQRRSRQDKDSGEERTDSRLAPAFKPNSREARADNLPLALSREDEISKRRQVEKLKKTSRSAKKTD